MSVTIPGALADHLAAQWIGDEETAAALDAARRGRGRTLVIEPTSTRVLHVISRHAEHILSIRGAYSRAQIAAARLWIQRAGHAPAILTHRFEDTEEAYNATQCRDDIHDGDVLVIEREGVVGFLRSAWPAALTVAHGELHTVTGDPRTLDDGRYVASVEAAEKIAAEHGFPLAEQAEAADAEALHAVQLVTEAEANDGTWQGAWIGQQPTDGLFALDLPAEQGALFDDRAAVPAAVEVEVEQPAVTPNVAPEVTRASVDAYLRRTYPALFAPEQAQPLALPPVQMWAVTQRVVIRGEWQGLIMCGLGYREARDRAGVLRYTGSKAVEVVPCEHGPHAHRDAQLAARCEGCGYQIPTGTQWHEACRPYPRPTPGDLARRAAAIAADLDRALDASAAVAANYDDEPPF
ncbi:hypothetical protein QFZ24_003240 [Streptomyces phaeochromogenes]|uniref:hypothetical protein n=1 Tax=Streptomyces phaeochromogenes TaxID=1923 RepID=UPI0027921C35|nr:hypothetical protein [Streptomyces phaeochromogenes]MDQ0949317.1 hypothetical protein [Streptomyces phaeochromogenes]